MKVHFISLSHPIRVTGLLYTRYAINNIEPLIKEIVAANTNEFNMDIVFQHHTLLQASFYGKNPRMC